MGLDMLDLMFRLEKAAKVRISKEDIYPPKCRTVSDVVAVLHRLVREQHAAIPHGATASEPAAELLDEHALFEIVKQHLVEVLNIEPERITPSADLFTDLEVS